MSEFARVRPPGIYKEDYLKELFNRYGDPADTPAPPQLPDWCVGMYHHLCISVFMVIH